MTRKQLQFIIQGMINEDRELAEKRLIEIFFRAGDDHAINALTDGIITDVECINDEDALEYIKKRVDVNVTKITEVIVNDISQEVTVNFEYQVYKKENGTTWDTSYEKRGDYTVPSTSKNSYHIPRAEAITLRWLIVSIL